jgi:HEAT repeat protein
LLKNGFGSHTIEVVEDGKTINYDLFGSAPRPAESSETPAIMLAQDQSGGWQHVVIDMSRTEELRGIYLTAGNAKYWPVDISTKASISIASVQFVDSATRTPIMSAGNDSDDPDREAKLAADITDSNYSGHKQAILAMLKESNPEVVMNAANVYTRVKDRSATDELTELSKHLDPRIAEMALRALKFEGTDTARVALNTALANGTFEANRYFAALTLADEKDPSLAESFSLLIDSKNRESRLAAVKGLAAMPGDTPRKFLLAMLLDTDPEVEAAVAQLEDPKFEDFEKRMQWYAINDASDWVRAQCNIAMIKSPLPGFATEGFKGISDDSSIVRILVLQYLEQHPSDKARPNILGALQDPNEEVRAQALKTLATMPTPANLNELARVGMDIDPRVQLALIDLAKKQSLKLSEPILDQLKKSADPTVVGRLKDL